MKKPGKVYLVGAGPGDPSLITVRGKDLVSTADIIVADDLVNPLHFQNNPHAEIIYVGKRGPGSPQGAFFKYSQTGINQLMIKLAKKGKKVVRLKGGDPIIFGRGGEEMEALRKARVSYEVVPGVTSPVAAPAYAGIPLSDRRWASTITFITGQESRDEKIKTPGVDWESLSPQGTLVVLMGVSSWASIRNKLLSLGWPSTKTVAAIQSATWGDQKTIVTTLADSLKIFKKEKLVSPAILIVGDVGRLAHKLAWVKKERPLLGTTVVVTRPRHQSAELTRFLEDKGAFVISCPAIEIQPVSDDLRTLSVIHEIQSGYSSYDLLIFLSENGVRSFHSLIGPDSGWLKKTKIIAVGPHTREIIQKLGWPVHDMPADFNAQGILKRLGSVRGKRILIPRVQDGPRDFVDRLAKLGAQVDEISTYRNIPAKRPSNRLKDLILKGVDVISFTSGSTVENFLKFFSSKEISKIFSRTTALSIGSSTTATLKKYRIKKILTAKPSTTEGLVQSLIHWKN